MYDNKRSVMGKWKRILIAAALTASMILALPVWNVGRAQAAPDLNRGCSLTINRPTGNAGKSSIKVDLYKVADAEVLTGYDAYKLTLNSAYDTEITRALFNRASGNDVSGNNANANASYRDLAQEMAKIVLKTRSGEISPTVTLDLSKANTLDNLPAGMYLVIAHGSNLNRAEEYTSTRTNGEKEQIVTMSYSEDKGYVYTYLPELVALPSRGNTIPNGSFNTADTVDWSYQLTATLKSEEEAQYASLQIGKTFMRSGETIITGENGCVFQITATMDNDENVVYSNVVAIPYEGNANGSVTLPKAIPVKAKVTVTEIYSGAAFTIDGSDSKTITSAVADGENGQINNRVFFTNINNGSNINGSIVTNSFTHDVEGWKWNGQIPTSAPAQSETTGQ